MKKINEKVTKEIRFIESEDGKSVATIKHFKITKEEITEEIFTEFKIENGGERDTLI